MEFEKIFTSFISNPNAFVRQLQMKDAILFAVIDALQAQDALASTKTQDVKKAVADLTDKIAQLKTANTEVARLQSVNAQLQADNAKLQPEVARLQSVNAQLQADNAKLQPEVARLQSVNAQLQSVPVDVNTVCSTYIKDLDTLVEFIAKINEQFKDRLTCKIEITPSKTSGGNMLSAIIDDINSREHIFNRFRT
jgi:chromosome segregation ATPase